MRPFVRIGILALTLALAASLAGCVNSEGSAELKSDETAVPDGMGVMYEFYTTS